MKQQNHSNFVNRMVQLVQHNNICCSRRQQHFVVVVQKRPSNQQRFVILSFLILLLCPINVFVQSHNPIHCYNVYHCIPTTTTTHDHKHHHNQFLYKRKKSKQITSSIHENQQQSHQLNLNNPVNQLRQLLLVSSYSNKPWRSDSGSGSNRRGSSSMQQHQQRQQPRRYATNPYDEFNVPTLHADTAFRDKRTRFYSVNFRSRKPNELSWTTRIIFLTTLFFGIQSLYPSITQQGMKISNKILAGEQLYRLVTPLFLHGNIIHLLTNMMSLSRMGSDVERLFGSSRFVATYVGAGIVGNLVSAYQSPNPSLGASGSVFGIVGAYFVYLNRNEWLLGNSGSEITNGIIQTIGINFVFGLMNKRIDQWAHLGGLLGGATFAYFIGPRLYLLNTNPSTNKSSNNNNNIDDDDDVQNYHVPEYRTVERRQQNIIVDRPIYRLPNYIERIPTNINKVIRNRIIQPVDNFLYQRGIFQYGTTKNRPWSKHYSTRSSRHQQQQQQQQHRNILNDSRSIKPGYVDEL